MSDERMKYSTAFTAGALLLRETEALIYTINSINDYLKGKEKSNYESIPVNAESSKKRLKLEIDKRLHSIKNEHILENFKFSDNTTKKIILFYSVCKCYPIIKHFMLEIVYIKWQNMDYELEVSDFINFLYRKMDFHPELEKITDNSIYKCGQVALKMLIDLGMLNKNKIQKIGINHSIIREIIKVGDNWFMDVLLLNDSEKKDLL